MAWVHGIVSIVWWKVLGEGWRPTECLMAQKMLTSMVAEAMCFAPWERAQ